MEKLQYEQGVYFLSSKAKHFFTVFTKSAACKCGEYAEEIDVLCVRKSVAEAKHVAMAALKEDYVNGLYPSRVVWRPDGCMF